MIKLFFNAELSWLNRHADLITLGLVDESEKAEFYAELTSYDAMTLDPWVRDNIVRKLKYKGLDPFVRSKEFLDVKMKGDASDVAAELEKWFVAVMTHHMRDSWKSIPQAPQIEMWGDNHEYDWLCFCELWSGALHMPPYIFRTPFSLSTVLRMRGLSPSIDREKYVGLTVAEVNHDALLKAKITGKCFRKLVARR